MPYLKPILIISGFFLLACSFHKEKPRQKLTRISIHFHLPEKLSGDYAEIVDATIFINFYGNDMLYELPYHVTNEVNNKLIYDSLKYEYFIKERNAAFGYNIKSLDDPFGKKINVDSGWAVRILKNMELGDFLKAIKIKKVSTAGNIDTYYFDDEKYDSGRYHYDKRLEDILFSLSPVFDASHKSRLHKVQLFAKPDTSAATRHLENFNTTEISMQRLPAINEKEITNLFKRFKKN